MTAEEIARVAALGAKPEGALRKFLRGSPLTLADARCFWGHPRGGRVTREELDELERVLVRAVEATAEPGHVNGLPGLSTCFALRNLHRLLRSRFEAEALAGD